MRIYLGPWRYRAGRWDAPQGTTARLDLRTVGQIAAGTGHGVFLTDTLLGAAYHQLASDPEETLTGARLSTLRDRLDLPKRIQRRRLTAVLWELLTEHAGTSICPPLMPTLERHLELHLGPCSVRQPFSADAREWPIVQQRIHADYRAMRKATAAKQLPKDFHRRALTVWMEKYQLDDPAWFIPADLPSVMPLPHQTTITDSFTTADSTTLGPTLTWAEYNNSALDNRWEIFSNAATNNAGTGGSGAFARAEADVSSADHSVQVVVAALGTGTDDPQAGPMCRFDPGVVSGYLCRGLQVNDTMDILKIVAAAATSIDTPSSYTYTTNDLLKIVANGSTIQRFVNGVQTGADVTDTSFGSGTRGGVYGYTGTTRAVRLTNWAMSDVGGGGGGSSAHGTVQLFRNLGVY